MKWLATFSTATLIALSAANANASETIEARAASSTALAEPKSPEAQPDKSTSSVTEGQSDRVGHIGKVQTKENRFGSGSRF